MKQETGFFNQHPDFYDLMIPWEQRLAREMPFFQKIFSANHCRAVLDCGCGTGSHVIAFSKLGLDSVGLDNSPAMIQYAQQKANKANVPVRFYIGDFQSVNTFVPQKMDCIISLGNSLAILKDEKAIQKTIQSMYRSLNPKGMVIFQVVNFNRMEQPGITGLPPRFVVKDGKEYLFLRHFDIHDKKVKIIFTLLAREANQWTQEVHSTELFYYTRPLLNTFLTENGFKKIKFYGDMALNKFSPKDSSDFIVIAQK